MTSNIKIFKNSKGHSVFFFFRDHSVQHRIQCHLHACHKCSPIHAFFSLIIMFIVPSTHYDGWIRPRHGHHSWRTHKTQVPGTFWTESAPCIQVESTQLGKADMSCCWLSGKALPSASLKCILTNNNDFVFISVTPDCLPRWLHFLQGWQQNPLLFNTLRNRRKRWVESSQLSP